MSVLRKLFKQLGILGGIDFRKNACIQLKVAQEQRIVSAHIGISALGLRLGNDTVGIHVMQCGQSPSANGNTGKIDLKRRLKKETAVLIGHIHGKGCHVCSHLGRRLVGHIFGSSACGHIPNRYFAKLCLKPGRTRHITQAPILDGWQSDPLICGLGNGKDRICQFAVLRVGCLPLVVVGFNKLQNHHILANVRKAVLADQNIRRACKDLGQLCFPRIFAFKRLVKHNLFNNKGQRHRFLIRGFPHKVFGVFQLQHHLIAARIDAALVFNDGIGHFGRKIRNLMVSVIHLGVNLGNLHRELIHARLVALNGSLKVPVCHKGGQVVYVFHVAPGTGDQNVAYIDVCNGSLRLEIVGHILKRIHRHVILGDQQGDDGVGDGDRCPIYRQRCGYFAAIFGNHTRRINNVKVIVIVWKPTVRRVDIDGHGLLTVVINQILGEYQRNIDLANVA